MKVKNHLNFLLLTSFLLSFIGAAQVINIGVSKSYALYSTGGAVTNGGTIFETKITGNVGTASDPTLPGFGNIDGKLTTVSNATANTQLNSDVLAVYADLNSAVPTFFPAALLGNGQVLFPGVYSISAPAVLNLQLTLDAQNNPNAQFIVKIGGAFSSNANAKVKLINCENDLVNNCYCEYEIGSTCSEEAHQRNRRTAFFDVVN